MSDERYSNREIDQIHVQIVKELKEIKSEVQKTNGRVRLNEKMIWMAMGAIGILAFIVGNNLLNL